MNISVTNCAAQSARRRVANGYKENQTVVNRAGQNENIEVKFAFPLLRPERHMIGFESDEAILQKLRERLRRLTDEELIRFGRDVRRLAENPFRRQLEEAKAEWKRRKKIG